MKGNGEVDENPESETKVLDLLGCPVGTSYMVRISGLYRQGKPHL